MTWRRHLRTVRATLALWLLAILGLATNARAWLQRRRGAGPGIPWGVHMLVAPTPDDGASPSTGHVVIDLTEHDRVSAGSWGR